MEVEDIKQVAVIGAGLMGFGIAVEYARFGYNVAIYNTSEASSNKALDLSRETLDLMIETDFITTEDARAAMIRMTPFTDIEAAAAGADFVVESVLESLDLKQEVFATLDKVCPPPVILATNTSNYRVTDIATSVKHPERVVATHYFQPPHFVPLVEVVAGEKTDPKVIDVTAELLRILRKRVAVINVDLPAFAGNRIQRAIRREVKSLVDKGVCSPETIDDVISYGFGRRMAYTSIFKRWDLIGLDFFYMSSKRRGIEPWGPLAERVERGDLGMKSGKGFYDWTDESVKATHRRLNTELIRLMKQDMDAGDI